MTLHTPVYIQPASGDPTILFSAQELRRNLQALMSVASPGGQSGVTPLDGQLAVSQHAGGANFSVDVAAGHAFVVGSDVSNQSAYGCWNDGVVNVATPSPPASGTEVHRLVLQVKDKFSNALWTGYTANLTLLADTGSGTPAAPASSITLALISISAGQGSVLNANITDQRPLLSVQQLISAYKSASLGRTSTTNSADPDLTVPVAANAVYLVEAVLFYHSSSATGNMTFIWLMPSGAGGNSAGWYTGSGGGALDGTVNAWNFSGQKARVDATPGNTDSVTLKGLLTTSSTSGSFTLSWAGDNSGATVTLEADSYMTARRIH